MIPLASKLKEETHMQQCLIKSNLDLGKDSSVYRGKVRDVYRIQNKMFMVATDRLSAFDHILPKPIPYKGQVLNQIAVHNLLTTNDIVPNWLLDSPDPNVSFGQACEPFKIEMVIRGYLTGHAWREYSLGKRTLCGEDLPEGLKQNDPLPFPIITPTTKADQGHDMDISRTEIIKQGLATVDEWSVLERHTRALFKRGQKLANEQGLILVDTKYEFGKSGKNIILIDEIHTPDSSRFFYLDGYAEKQQRGEPQKQLSKEFVREWLMEQGFQGLDGQQIPDMPDDFVAQVSERYIDLYQQLTGKTFVKADNSNIEERINQNIQAFLQKNPI